MPLDVTGAVSDGFDRAVARNGLMLMGLFFVVNLLNMHLTGTPVSGNQAPPFGGVGALLLGLASLVLSIGALRTFAGGETEVLDMGVFQRNMGYAAVNMFVGLVVFGLIVAAGFVLLVIPGVFLLVSLLFWNVYVAVEDRNFIDALQESWALTRGNRWQVLGVGILIFLVSLVVNAVFAAPVMAGMTPPMLDAVLFAVPSAFTSVFSLAVIMNAYRQLTAGA